ncbi:KinB-signaling pathway activation protein [Bacillus suaedaesalsae]|uniref:KinB-signaling pathway activation protein n=1 Tax=Bacillus suaedaesalsae TaxID=2810349 RepID=A0ABS2DF04_9BACI|nr:KinB-signaling pathway activation protein [Bacillus suaedaesalsae]
MKSRNLVKLFLSTLLVGGLSTVIIGFLIKWSEYKVLFLELNMSEILSVTLWLLGVGFIFSVISQMGFFAYLTVHRFGLGIFKGLWNPVQILLIAFVLFDLVYFRYQWFADKGDGLLSYFAFPVFILLYSLIVAYIKSKETNKQAFIPALFFMIVVTSIEWVPALRANEESWLYLMLFPILVCNSYQLLLLHRLISKADK